MSIVFEDIFEVVQLNNGGKKYEKINRLTCKGTTYDVDLTVDVNSELLTIKDGERATIALASTMNSDGTLDDGQFDAYPDASLMDSYDYVMHGRIFKIEAKDGQLIDVYASFGGLLMQLTGEQSQLELIEPDMRLYMLVRSGGLDNM